MFGLPAVRGDSSRPHGGVRPSHTWLFPVMLYRAVRTESGKCDHLSFSSTLEYAVLDRVAQRSAHCEIQYNADINICERLIANNDGFTAGK